MQIYAAVAEVGTSVHEWSQEVSIVTVLWGFIALLGAGVLYYALADRTGIRTTLDKLVQVVEELRVDLASNYAKKLDVAELDRKVEKLRDHITERSRLHHGPDDDIYTK